VNSAPPPDPATAAAGFYEAWVARLIPAARSALQLAAAVSAADRGARASACRQPLDDDDIRLIRLPGPRGETGDPCGDGPLSQEQGRRVLAS